MIDKLCAKCGKRSKVKPRERRCKQIVEHGIGKFARKFYCYGLLSTVEKPAKARETDLDKAAHAARMLTEALTAMTRAMTRVKRWQKRQAYYMAKAEGRIRQAVRTPKPKVDRLTRAIELEE